MGYEYELPYEDEPRHLTEYNDEVFSSLKEAQDAYDWLQENWHPKEGGYSADDIFDRLNYFDGYYNEDGELEGMEFEFDPSP